MNNEHSDVSMHYSILPIVSLLAVGIISSSFGIRKFSLYSNQRLRFRRTRLSVGIPSDFTKEDQNRIQYVCTHLSEFLNKLYVFLTEKFWSNVKTTFTGEKILDENAQDHREQFTGLVRELKGAFRPDNLLISLTVLPNTNSTGKTDQKILLKINII